MYARARRLVKFFDCRTRAERREHVATACTVKGQSYWPSELYFAGIVISDGEADPMHGDTALTLMIGASLPPPFCRVRSVRRRC